jgi:hypothetical protein
MLDFVGLWWFYHPYKLGQMQKNRPENGTSCFCRHPSQHLKKTKKGIFCHFTKDDFDYIKSTFTVTKTNYKLKRQVH